MGRLFVFKGLVNPFITAINIPQSKRKVTFGAKSSMEKDYGPALGTNTDARWDFGSSKDGYLDTSCI